MSMGGRPAYRLRRVTPAQIIHGRPAPGSGKQIVDEKPCDAPDRVDVSRSMIFPPALTLTGILAGLLA